MTNGTGTRGPEYTMTIRVYTVAPGGIITADSGTREIQPVEELPDVQDGFAPSGGPRHQSGQLAVSR